MYFLDTDASFVGGGLRRLLLLGPLCLLLPITLSAAAMDALRHVRFREPHQAHYILDESSRDKAWTQAHHEGSTSHVEIGSRIVLQVEPGIDLAGLITGRGLTLSHTIQSNVFILQAVD